MSNKEILDFIGKITKDTIIKVFCFSADEGHEYIFEFLFFSISTTNNKTNNIKIVEIKCLDFKLIFCISVDERKMVDENTCCLTKDGASYGINKIVIGDVYMEFVESERA